MCIYTSRRSTQGPLNIASSATLYEITLLQQSIIYIYIHTHIYIHIRSIEDSRSAASCAAPSWLYPPCVDPSDEDTLVKLAIAMSLERESPPAGGALGRFVFDSLCEGLPQVVACGGARSLPALQLLGTLAYGLPAEESWRPREQAAQAVKNSLLQRTALVKDSPTSEVQVSSQHDESFVYIFMHIYIYIYITIEQFD